MLDFESHARGPVVPATARFTARFHFLFALLLPVAPFFASVGCTTNPATGRSQLNLLSRDQEIAMGSEAMPQIIEQYGGPLDDEYMQSYVTQIGMSMVPFTEGDYASLPWQFTVLDSDVINAFALPGGKIFITRGLLIKLDDEAELAGVLGHEIGHVTAEHADRHVSNQLILAGVVAGTAVAAGQSDSTFVSAGVPLLVGIGGEGFILKYGRNDELQADALGMRYMARAGYDPAAQRDVMEVLKEASGDSSGRQPQFLSTHPYPETRIRKIDELLARDYPPDARTRLVRNKSKFQESVMARLEKN